MVNNNLRQRRKEWDKEKAERPEAAPPKEKPALVERMPHPEDVPEDDPFASDRTAVSWPAPTDADEPPWKGWYSCEDCNGWFCGESTCYENGVEVCPSCAEKRLPEGTTVVGE